MDLYYKYLEHTAILAYNMSLLDTKLNSFRMMAVYNLEVIYSLDLKHKY